MRIKIELTGRTPMLMHNIRLADPDDEFTRQISAITKKRVKTEEDRREIERLEWFGGLYVDSAGPIMPTANIRRCLVQAAKITKQGTAVNRALSFSDLHVPVIYDGPRDPLLLWENPAFRDRSAVGIQGKRTMRVRPKFPEWSIVSEAELLDDVMDLGDVRKVADRAGLAEGLGDNRISGYGRFNATVVG